ncbi:MAG TPA: hypothetical protein VKU41_13235 [Polyangiaceae bacterium]|nr:hypothetical protein [Polyangiaceae bacterium]
MSADRTGHPSHFPTIFTLPEGDGVLHVAERCRSTFLSFLNGVWLQGWAKEELAGWLRGPYEAVTRLAAELLDARSTVIGSGSPSQELREQAVEKVMAQTHRECVNVLRAMADPDQGTSLVFGAVRSGLVMRCEDRQGGGGWVPTATPRMRLGERLQSLVAVDFLTRPEDYESLLSLCGNCGAVEFDAMSRARGLCRYHSGSLTRIRPGSEVDGLADLAGPEPQASSV